MGLLTIPIFEKTSRYTPKILSDGTVHFTQSSEGISTDLQSAEISNGFVSIPEGAKVVSITRGKVEHILSVIVVLGAAIVIGNSI